ncbi:MAG: hypothetical protein V7719_08350 [Psychroserpens sp.]|uniref:hypothetical protein n=1 Tax=Psychroserpens sp. TaxID=2020870 RepID=UPI00300128F3
MSFSLMLMLSIHASAQEDSTRVKNIKPLPLGVKVYVPNIITANANINTNVLDSENEKERTLN